MINREITTAAVIGTGMMGPGIALCLAMGGLRTTILSRSESGAASGLSKAQAQADLLAANRLATREQIAAALRLLHASTAFDETVASAGMVVESVREDMQFKQELFARLDALAQPGALLASNTSGLSISSIASRCVHPERVLTTHFWNPAHLIPLVEVVKGNETTDESVETVRSLLIRCGKTPVVVRKDRPGQLGNRLQMALVREAANIIAEGIATAEDIDTVAKDALGLRMPAYGILEHQDVTGLPLGLAVLEYVAPDLYNEPRAPQYYRDLVERGNFGAATGNGFYDWSDKSADDVRTRRDAFLVEVLRWRRSSDTDRAPATGAQAPIG